MSKRVQSAGKLGTSLTQGRRRRSEMKKGISPAEEGIIAAHIENLRLGGKDWSKIEEIIVEHYGDEFGGASVRALVKEIKEVNWKEKEVK